MKLFLQALLLVWVVSPAGRLFGADDKPLVTTDPLADVALLPTLVEYAAAHHIPLVGIAVAEEGAKPQKGDAVTLLVTLFEGNAERQWLACVEADDLTADEQRKKPQPEGVVHSGTGQVWHYPTTRTALNVVFIGPFSPAAARSSIPVEKHERVLTSPEYLSYGLNQYCRAEMRERQSEKDAGIKDAWISYSSFPLSADTVKMGQRVAALTKITAADDRLRAGCWFPLGSFVEIIMKVQAFEDVVKHIVDMPSIWSIARHLGVINYWHFSDFVRVSEPGAGGESATYRFGLRLNLNEQFSIKSALTVTAPRPPLQVCAGILGVYAERPSDASQRLFIRLVSAHRAAEASQAADRSVH